MTGRVEIYPPPPKTPVRATQAPSVEDERVILLEADALHHYGYRAYSEVYMRGGHPRVMVVRDEDWCQWKWGYVPLPPERMWEFYAGAVWLD